MNSPLVGRQGSAPISSASRMVDTVAQFKQSGKKKAAWFLGLTVLMIAMIVISILVGSYDLSPIDVIRTLLGLESGPAQIIVWDIRMPRIIAALVAGSALGLSGMAAQSLLRNPLASPFTLGISQSAAFGAAFAIVVLGAGGMQSGAVRPENSPSFFIGGLYTVTLFAFLGSLASTIIILLLARLKKMSPEVVVLGGVAMSSLSISGTILVQYFATEIEIATVVFWTFGDVTRSSWREIGILSLFTSGAFLYYFHHRWALNAMSGGDDAAKSLGVETNHLRLKGMVIASLAAALTTAFFGVIAFLGLLAPHIGRRLIGVDYRWLIPFSCLLGGLLLLIADTLGRLLVGSGTLPVGVLTSFMGAPLFLYLLMKGQKR